MKCLSDALSTLCIIHLRMSKKESLEQCKVITEVFNILDKFTGWMWRECRRIYIGMTQLSLVQINPIGKYENMFSRERVKIWNMVGANG